MTSIPDVGGGCIFLVEASPAMKDALRCTNKQTEMIMSDAQRLERLLLGELGLLNR
jgi:hypothetical protein